MIGGDGKVEMLPAKKVLMEAIIEVMMDGVTLTTSEINQKVILLLDIPEILLKIEDANCSGSEYSYRMRWARTELKQKGLILNSKRGV